MESEDAEILALNLVGAALNHQKAKWGDQRTHSDEHWHIILSEEVGEVARAIYEKDAAQVEHELAQVGAVALEWLESLQLKKGLDQCTS